MGIYANNTNIYDKMGSRLEVKHRISDFFFLVIFKTRDVEHLMMEGQRGHQLLGASQFGNCTKENLHLKIM